MRSGQRKGRLAMIEIRRDPCRSVVAGLALRREPRLRVIRIAGAIEIGNVAAVTICRRALKFAADVAGSTLQIRMRSGQSEAGEFQVIELRVVPCVESVARLAGARKVQLHVARIRRLLEIGRMARHAVG